MFLEVPIFRVPILCMGSAVHKVQQEEPPPWPLAFPARQPAPWSTMRSPKEAENTANPIQTGMSNEM